MRSYFHGVFFTFNAKRIHCFNNVFPGLSDQYSDGKAAKVWQLYIGESSERTAGYKEFMGNLLRKSNCTTVLDAACGTG